jgi:hypothetical protein
VPTPSPYRFLLAATALLVFFACAYGASVRWANQAAGASNRPARTVVASTAPAGRVGAASAATQRSPPRPVVDGVARDFTGLPTERTHVAAPTQRYVGTVGGEPATVALRWVRPDSVVGTCFLWRRATAYPLTTATRRQPGRLQLEEPVTVFHQPPTEPVASPGYWQLTSGPGPQLRGYWRDAAGRQQPLVLHESYQGAVRYTIENLCITAPLREADERRPKHKSDFLRLLGPAAHSPLARELYPSRAERRALVLDNEGEAFCTSTIQVQLNDFDLLSYYQFDIINPFEGQNDLGLTATLLDLRTGRELSVASQLRSGYQRPLRQLLTWQLQHNPQFNYLESGQNPANARAWGWRDAQGQPTPLVSLPTDGEALALTGPGLEATYYGGTLLGGGGPLEPRYSVLVPYQALRPLVRPDTPLARMLRARGLW